LALACGAIPSLLVERLLRPDPRLTGRGGAALAIHLGVWLLGFSVLLAIVRRPWFASCLLVAALLLVAATSNAKSRSLREPFVFQDYEFFVDMLRHPRLFVPFFGIGRALLGVCAFAAVLYAGLSLEPSLLAQSGNATFWTGCAVLAASGTALAWTGGRRAAPTFDPAADLRRSGLLASLYLYARAELQPFEPPAGPAVFSATVRAVGRRHPHLVAVQSESFFDPRRLHPGIDRGLLPEFDALCDSAARCGRLEVPAWGANTVRSEFAFLSGIDTARLGVDRFNPYRRAALRGIPTVASFLRRAGYRTLCVHPYDGAFYRRDRVLPALGFDEFIDVRAFTTADLSGPFVGDRALAGRVDALLADAREPLFVFVITMENHGPLELERPLPEDFAPLRGAPALAAHADLAVYLRHLRNADRMIGRLRASLERTQAGDCLCWYGDHVPVLPAAYDACEFADGRTDYVLWSAASRGAPRRADLRLHDLAGGLLELAGF
jgi:phosphoglycerol transferase MdoB-like AlkP superfamily enzyme